MLILIPAALAASLYLLVREMIPALRAIATGRIRTKGHNTRVVERALEPERFAGLVRQRLKLGLAGVGAALIVAVMLLGRFLSRGGY